MPNIRACSRRACLSRWLHARMLGCTLEWMAGDIWHRETTVAKKSTDTTRAVLRVGWRATSSLEPSYWLDGKAKPGGQSDSDLVTVAADDMAAHTAVIAQSGSGKSFFLGRLVEELLVETRARCLILDPNADFRQVTKLVSAAHWTKAHYDKQLRRGWLTHESSKKEFEGKWSAVSKAVRVAAGSVFRSQSDPLGIWWPSVSLEFIAGDVDGMTRSCLHHCHAFVQALGQLVTFKQWAHDGAIDLLDEAEALFKKLSIIAQTESVLLEVFPPEELDFLIRSRQPRTEGENSLLDLLMGESWIPTSIRQQIQRVLDALEYTDPGVMRFYFARAREFESAGILAPGPNRTRSLFGAPKLEVIDLASLPDVGARLVVVNALIASEWERARNAWSWALAHPADKDERVPTFVVVDEAHNLIPAHPTSSAAGIVREQFRSVVAEGRKYGLFLLLVSQRPDKLDPLVLSECENKAIMRISTASVLSKTREQLGLDDVPQGRLDKCLDFGIGRMLLAGRWTPDGPVLAYSAARRTVEGGRNLRAAHWAHLPEKA